MTYEEKYWMMRENMDRAFNKWFGNRTESNKRDWHNAVDDFNDFCVFVLEKLIEENSDVLKRLADESEDYYYGGF